MRRFSQSEHWFLPGTRVPYFGINCLSMSHTNFPGMGFLVHCFVTSDLLEGSLELWVEVTASRLESTMAAIFH